MLSPVWFEWRDGGINIWVPTPEGGKVAHVQRDPRVTVVVANHEWPYKGFEIRGEATVSGDDFYGVLRRTALRYDGPEAAERMVAVVCARRRHPGRARGHPGVGLRGRGLSEAGRVRRAERPAERRS